MKQSSGLVWILFKHELRMLLRDRRTIIFSIVIPVLVLPVMLFASSTIEARKERKLERASYSYAVTGTQADLARALISEGIAAAEEGDADEAGDATGVDDSEGADESGQNLHEMNAAEPEAAMKSEAIAFYVEAIDAEVADGPVPAMKVVYLRNRGKSAAGARRMTGFLRKARDKRRDEAVRSTGIHLELESVGRIDESDLATSAQRSGSTIGRFLTALLVFFVFTGGAVIATDSIAGERERGTLETLLTTAAARSHIVSAKLLSILAVALFITVTQVANLLIYVGLGVIELPKTLQLEVSPLAALVLFVLFVPIALLVSSVLLMLSAFARSYKEAQMNFFPVLLLGAVPALAAVLPGISLRSAVVLVPISNTSVAVREVLTGKFDWPFLAIAFAVTTAAALWSLRLTVRSLSIERMIVWAERSAEEPLHPSARFEQNVLKWFGVFWVVMFVVAVNVPFLQSMPRQVIFNVVVLFGGGSLLLARFYKLPLRDALALRPVKPAVWLAVLAGIPAAHVVGMGVFQLANRIFPVPESLLESFAEEIIPEGMPLAVLFLLIAVLPGVFEEIAFRGVLLHGLRRRFHPVVLCLVVGLIFGLFHVSLFRIIPTMYLGVILTGVALLTGSVFPAMAWHAGNNALALGLGLAGADLSDVEPSLTAAAFAVLALVFWILWRARTPYPGLRRRARKPQ